MKDKSLVNEMPKSIKAKLKKYARLQIEVSQCNNEIANFFEANGVPYDNLIASAYNNHPQTEALAFLNNGECADIDSTIADIEEIYCYFKNLSK